VDAVALRATGGTIRVHVCRSTGSPVEGVPVEVIGRNGREWPPVATAPDGIAAFSVQPGSYRARVASDSLPGLLPPWSQDITVSYANAHPGFYASEVEVRKGGTANIRLTMFLPATVWGIVLGPDGEPVEGAWAAIESLDSGLESLVSRARTDASGCFELTDVYPGRYRTQVSFEPGHLYREVPRPLPQEIDIREEDRIPLRIQLGGGEVALTGVVLDQDNMPVPCLEVWCSLRQDPARLAPGERGYGINDVLATTRTDEQGRYRLRVPRASVRIRVGLNAYSTSAPQDGLLTSLPRPVDCDLQDGDDRELDPIIVDCNRAYRIEGTLSLDPTWAAQRSLGVYALRVWIDDGSEPRMAKLSLSGAFLWQSETPHSVVTVSVRTVSGELLKTLPATPVASVCEPLDIAIP
jgi:hypothetical protein